MIDNVGDVFSGFLFILTQFAKFAFPK